MFPGVDVLANNKTAFSSHAHAFDFPEYHRLAEQFRRVSSGIACLKPADWFGRNPVACKVFGGFGGVIPIELTEIGPLFTVKFEMLRRDP